MNLTGLIIFLALSLFSYTFASNKKSVTILTAVYPPYIVLDSANKVGGVSYELAKAIFNEAGYAVKFDVMLFTKTVENLFANENTIMLGLLKAVPDYQTLNVTEVLYMNFSTTYFYNARKNPNYGAYTDISQTKNKTVVVLKGTGFFEDIIRRSGGILKTANYQTEVLQSVLAGTYDFGHCGVIEGLLYLFTSPGFKDIKPVKFTVSETKSGMVFREGAYEIRDDFVKKVKEMKEDGRLFDVYQNSLRGIPLVYYENLVPEKIIVNSNVSTGTNLK